MSDMSKPQECTANEATKEWGAGARRIRQALGKDFKSVPSRDEYSIGDSYNEQQAENKTAKAKRAKLITWLAGREQVKETLSCCFRCKYKNMPCEYSLASEGVLVCRRCKRAGEKYCIKERLIPFDDLEASSMAIVQVDGPASQDEESSAEIRDLIDSYIGEQMVQAQPGLWVSVATAEHSMALPNAAPWRAALPHDRNMSETAQRKLKAQVNALKIEEEVQQELRVEKRQRARQERLEMAERGETEFNEEEDDNDDDDEEVRYNRDGMTELEKMHMPRLGYRPRAKNMCEERDIKQF
ncbi:hypothetical protein JX265_002600 [Neoarthrinium moseri]|uniref:Uncharacterized protein n=1 Tax=Neoarthrinium moseri TaxID=1658444 RepID=A0A9P9WUT3_9PEZI|nr:uncharacterized protein JN550_000414 [Neoarthrinium moseri]KAI1878232.1 hypothetical protein JN550_000414 [Neoarthrinium moseri]KAI1879646.1 hypothetical protein JX265_002600 [Neoarthrinium moseri]